MTYILRHNDENRMSYPEIETALRVLVVAGSETTASALSCILGNLLKNRDTLRKVSEEIHRAFRHPSEINAERVGEQGYLGAAIE